MIAVPAGESTTGSVLADLYPLMALSRALDDECARRLAAGEKLPHYHSGEGQEALMIAPVAAIAEQDQLIYTHRGYGHLLAKGVPLVAVVKDLLSRIGGTNHGLGGVMHVNAPELGVPGREGVFGTRFGLAVGLALAARHHGEDSVVLCFYGEAAGARGPLYEALNMAVLWKLPIVFLAENNGWSFTSRTDWLFPGGRMSDAWRSFVPVDVVDGNDGDVVHTATSRAVERARQGEGPTIIEGLTYRVAPHIWFDRADYQPSAEVERARQDDPLRRAEARLASDGWSAERLELVHEEARRSVLEAFREAEATPRPGWDDVATWIRP